MASAGKCYVMQEWTRPRQNCGPGFLGDAAPRKLMFMYNQHVKCPGLGLLPVTREPSQESALLSLAVGVYGGCRWALCPRWSMFLGTWFLGRTVKPRELGKQVHLTSLRFTGFGHRLSGARHSANGPRDPETTWAQVIHPLGCQSLRISSVPGSRAGTRDTGLSQTG